MISLIHGIFKKGTNELIHKTEVELQMQKINLWLPGDKEGKDKLGNWDQDIHTIIYKIDN